MNFFQTVKTLFSFYKTLKKDIKETQKKNQLYIGMSQEEFCKLSDDALFEAALARTEAKIESFENLSESIKSLNIQQRILFAINDMEMEVTNGGLCQFFVNSSRAVAPFVSEFMGIIGAIEHKKLYDNFIEKYNINVKELSSFTCEDIDQFLEQYEHYPFDEFDDEFYKLKPLQEYLFVFIKENKNCF